MKVVLHPAASAEFNEAVDYYADIDPALGQRCHSEIEQLFREAAAHPQSYRAFDPPARRHFSLYFPYAVIYLEQEDRLWIVAVMHMKRRPGYWKPRLSEP